MPDSPTPWVGLAALVAMFVIPFLPNWLFEGPRTVKHWPRRHVCGECGAPWTHEHICDPEPIPAAPRPLRGEIRRPPRPVDGPRVLTPRRTVVRSRAR